MTEQITTISRTLILVLAACICLLSVWGIYTPDRLRKLVSGIGKKDWGIHVAVAIRILFGAAMIIAAAGSRFPLILQFIGCLMIFAAILIMLAGRRGMRLLMTWLDGLHPAFIRAALVFGIAFGAFLIYSI